MEGKKISFGFSKINKRPNLIINKEPSKTEAKVELIKCLEGQEIKLVEEKAEEKPLVIPLKENQKTSAALASLIKRRAVLLGEEEPDNITDDQKEQTNISNSVDLTEDLEKRAARELLADIHSNGDTHAVSDLVLPVVKPDDLPLEGAKESSLDDYEHIPVQDFGKAMLRGMGWKEPPKTNKKGDPPLDETPMVRPKGMGLGADKALNKKPLLVAPEANEVLEIKRNAFVRILGGKHKELYGQIEGFDDHAGRVIVKMAIGGNKEAFNEFLCQPVSRKEYAQYGKCINTSKYEEYKKRENEYGQIILTQDEKDKIQKSFNIKNEKNVKKEKYTSPEKEDKYKKHSDNENEKKYIKKEKDRYQDYDYKREKESSSHRRDNDSYGEKHYSSNDSRYRQEKEPNRDEEYRKDDKKDSNKEYKRYESRMDYHRERERDNQQNYREYNKSSDTARQQERDRDYYAERNKRHGTKDIVDSSSESQNDSYSSKHKKTKKTKSSKKKSKKNKSKYKSESSDTDTSSSDTDSSSSSEEERRRKPKKKTKKSKKQRERARSRDRR